MSDPTTTIDHTTGNGFAIPIPEAEQQQIDQLYEGPDWLRSGSIEPPRAPGEFFSEQAYYADAFRRNEPQLADHLGLSPTQLREERAAFAGTIRDAGLDPEVGNKIHDALTAARIAGNRATDGLEEMNTQTRRLLREQFGEEDAADLLVRVQKFARSQPKLAEILRTGTVGSNPDIIEALAWHVRRHGIR